MLERLWAGWRSTYVRSSGDDGRTGSGKVSAEGAPGVTDPVDGSVFTRILRSDLPDDETHIVHRARTCFVIMNAYPYATGHVLVIPYREVADLELLEDEESAELWAVVTDAVRAVRRAFAPEGINVGVNLGRPAGGTVPEHLHVHVVPRWIGDSNFMTAIANTQTLPESLVGSAARLRSAWPQSSSAS